MSDQSDIRDFLQEAQSSREMFGTNRRERMAHCLRHFAAKKIPLLTCCDERHLNRSLSTLQGYCRDLGLRFPDYVPFALQTPEERKRKKGARMSNSREVDWLNLEVGRRFYNRAGAVVEIVERRDSGLAQFDLNWKPRGNAMLIVVKTINGNGRYAVFSNGDYHSSEDHPLDLMREAT